MKTEIKEEFLRKHFYTTVYKPEPTNNQICVYCGDNIVEHDKPCDSDIVIKTVVNELNNDDFIMVHQIFNEWCCMNNDQRKLAIERYYTPNESKYGFTYYLGTVTQPIQPDNLNELLPTQIRLYFMKFIAQDPLLSKEYIQWYKSENEVKRMINYLVELNSSVPEYHRRAFHSLVDDWELYIKLGEVNTGEISTAKAKPEVFFEVIEKLCQLPSVVLHGMTNTSLKLIFHKYLGSSLYVIPDGLLEPLSKIQLFDMHSVQSHIKLLIESYFRDFSTSTTNHKIEDFKEVIYYLFRFTSKPSNPNATKTESSLDKLYKYFGLEVFNDLVTQYILENHESEIKTSILTINSFISFQYKYNLDFNKVSDILSGWILRFLKLKNPTTNNYKEMIPLIQVTNENVKYVMDCLALKKDNDIFGFLVQFVSYQFSRKLGKSILNYFDLEEITTKIENISLIFYHGLLLNCNGEYSFNTVPDPIPINPLIYSYYHKEAHLGFTTLELVLRFLKELKNHSHPHYNTLSFRSTIKTYFVNLFSFLDNDHYQGIIEILIENSKLISEWLLETPQTMPHYSLLIMFNNYRLAECLLNQLSELEMLTSKLHVHSRLLNSTKSLLNSINLLKNVENKEGLIIKSLKLNRYLTACEEYRDLLFMLNTFDHNDVFNILYDKSYDKKFISLIFEDYDAPNQPLKSRKLRELMLKLGFSHSIYQNEVNRIEMMKDTFKSTTEIEDIYKGIELKGINDSHSIEDFFIIIPEKLWSKSQYFTKFYHQFSRFKDDIKGTQDPKFFAIDVEMNRLNSINDQSNNNNNNDSSGGNGLNILDLPMTILSRIVSLLYRDKTFHYRHKINLCALCKKIFEICSSVITNNYNHFENPNRNYIGVGNPLSLNLNSKYCLFKEYPKFLRYILLNQYPIEHQEMILYERAESMSVEFDIEVHNTSITNTRIILNRNTNLKTLAFYVSGETNFNQIRDLIVKSPQLEFISFVVNEEWNSLESVIKCILHLQLPNLKKIYLFFNGEAEDDAFKTHLNIQPIKNEIQQLNHPHPIQFPKLKLSCVIEGKKFSGFDKFSINILNQDLSKEDIISFYSDQFSKCDSINFITISVKNVPILVEIATQFTNIKKLTINISTYHHKNNHLTIESLQSVFQQLNNTENIKKFSIFHRIFDYHMPIEKYSVFDDGYLTPEQQHQFYFSKIDFGNFKSTNHLNIKFVQ
ncbi:hypothetical protein DLAC_06688 [Tieghemostelium lacteum]|uniref:Uncharacterized protein n=1 Tax=Tieghemostelium lacteum TaxID=361077 RepID=A0A151ZFP6_TIELA|nr:hypothetical protein DLAC_06688 [Tieghemostelium lacteum]|eukprot:KYQ92690.1 hypothetical protein DLAC_06688 [Tieghemostelium lacteum]